MFETILIAALSKALFWEGSSAEIVGSNPTGGVDVFFVIFVFCNNNNNNIYLTAVGLSLGGSVC
jgi:hypothetical protein